MTGRYEDLLGDYDEDNWALHLYSRVEEDPDYVLQFLVDLHSEGREFSEMELFFLEKASRSINPDEGLSERYRDLFDEYGIELEE